MASLNSGFVSMEKSVPHQKERFTPIDKPHQSTVIELIFHVKNSNDDKLKEKIMAVSDPKSPDYGKHLSKAQIDELTANPEALKATMSFLNSVEGIQIKEGGNAYHIAASAPISSWEIVLKTEFFTFEKIDNKGGKMNVIRTHEYSLPESIAPFVSAVMNTVQFPMEITHGGPRIGGGPHITPVSIADLIPK